eukprot:768203-Hanusia_phi.AAC.5
MRDSVSPLHSHALSSGGCTSVAAPEAEGSATPRGSALVSEGMPKPKLRLGHAEGLDSFSSPPEGLSTCVRGLAAEMSMALTSAELGCCLLPSPLRPSG